MKFTKRILALITAVVLCLAPMALMVGAAENEIILYGSSLNNPCIYCGETRVYRSLENATFVEKEIVGTQSVCYINWYNNVEYRCAKCGEVKDRADIGIQLSHPTFYLNTATGNYYCPLCGIVKTW